MAKRGERSDDDDDTVDAADPATGCCHEYYRLNVSEKRRNPNSK
jgi:hypothetical protein